ncbi:MAG: poly(3-hydroxybutyrate) depolymerase [Planctomycetota bacterium]|jgi:poly(3-hydroxybutyrate) depolymerase
MILPLAALLPARLVIACLPFFAPQAQGDFETALATAGGNRAELERAVASVPEEERDGMRWLITHMPESDLANLTADYLLENHRIAYESWRTSPWRDSVDEDTFLDAVLPYASINERRDAWRAKLRMHCLPMVAGAESAGEAAALLNNAIWAEFGVKYSTKRKKADQSPFETIETGTASCTGLSVLLIDSCRSVGIPARFVGTPRWSDDSGNHSWVEIWDDGWHFTGAAEPSGQELDQGWFAGRAAGAKRDEPGYAIYATTWKDTPISFPLVWRPGDKSVDAVNVTDRYTGAAPDASADVSTGGVSVRIRAFDPATEQRTVAHITVGKLDADDPTSLADGELFFGNTNDESFDSNDHLTATLEAGSSYALLVQGEFGFRLTTFTAKDELLISLGLQGERSWDAADLGRQNAGLVAQLLWASHRRAAREDRSHEMESRVLEEGDLKLPFWYSVHGDKPAGGRSLYISMHGGGGAPKSVNDQQWENQKRLYTITEGIYLAPRAATDTWNLWHQGHIDGFFDRLIQDLIVFEDVNPDRVYLTGYSAGGDGVYQLAPRMADRFAAAAMMAGHPNEAQPDGLRNLPFALHVGGEDAAYDRNQIARKWKGLLADLAASDEGGYENQVEVHEGKGHWMDREDAVALPWMAEHNRNLRPERIVWLQDDVTHQRFYWLHNPEPKARERIVVEREGQVISILEAPAGVQLNIRLDDSMCDLDQVVVVKSGSTVLFSGVVPRRAAIQAKTLGERGDPRGIFSAEVSITTPAASDK